MAGAARAPLPPLLHARRRLRARLDRALPLRHERHFAAAGRLLLGQPSEAMRSKRSARKRVGVDAEADLRVRLAAVVAAAPVDVRPAAALRPSRSRPRCAPAGRRRGPGRSRARPRRGRASASRRARVALLVEAREEVEQIGDEAARPGPTARSSSACAGVISAWCVTSSPTIVIVDPAREHAVRGLRVGPDVELGGRRDGCPRRPSRPSARSARAARRVRARAAARRSSAARSRRA